MIICHKCKKESGGDMLPTLWYRLSQGDYGNYFCSRPCIVEYLAPELNKAVTVRQWVPTEEDKERMSQ